jgi:hypothetical protein
MTDPNVPATPPAPAPAAPYTAAAPAGKPTNVLAIIALIGAFLIPPAGIICGHIALGQIKKTGEGGHALALWGTILGYVFTILWILIFVMSIIIPLMILGTYGTVVDNLPGY